MAGLIFCVQLIKSSGISSLAVINLKRISVRSFLGNTSHYLTEKDLAYEFLARLEPDIRYF